MHALTLLLGIPSLIVMTPILPIPERVRQSTTIPLSRLGIYILIIGLSFLPTKAMAFIGDLTLVMALVSNYLLPGQSFAALVCSYSMDSKALVYIIAFYFKRPLSIVVPSQGETGSTPDELLQRKERSLQRAQLKKRIVWDLGVWLLLLPVGGGGIAWAAGRLTGQW